VPVAGLGGPANPPAAAAATARSCGYYFNILYMLVDTYAHAYVRTILYVYLFFPFHSSCAFDKRPPRSYIYDDDALHSAAAAAVINPLRDNWTN